MLEDRRLFSTVAIPGQAMVGGTTYTIGTLTATATGTNSQAATLTLDPTYRSLMSDANGLQFRFFQVITYDDEPVTWHGAVITAAGTANHVGDIVDVPSGGWDYESTTGNKGGDDTAPFYESDTANNPSTGNPYDFPTLNYPDLHSADGIDPGTSRTSDNPGLNKANHQTLFETFVAYVDPGLLGDNQVDVLGGYSWGVQTDAAGVETAIAASSISYASISPGVVAELQGALNRSGYAGWTAVANDVIIPNTAFVDFETSPKIDPGPSLFSDAGAEQDITLPGVATFTGGVVLGDATNFPAEDFGTPPNVYATSSSDNGGDPSLTPTVNINIAPAFTDNEISFALFNGETDPVDYTVNAFSGATMVATQSYPAVAANTDSGFTVVDIKAANITSLTIGPTDTSSGSWDFLLDSVNLNGSVQQAVPVPPTQPTIVGVTVAGLGQDTTITINGSGFGPAPSSVPFTGDLDDFSLSDGGGPGASPFTAGGSYFGNSPSDSVTLDYQSWTDNTIVIGGFGGSYGSNGAIIQPGDKLTFTLFNSGDMDSTGPTTALSGTVAAMGTAPPTPENSPNIMSFPPVAQLFVAQPTLEQSLVNDPNELTYAATESTDLNDANVFLNAAAVSGLTSQFSAVSSALQPIANAATFASASAAAEATEATEFWLMEQTPEYKNDVAVQQSSQNLGILGNIEALTENTLASLGATTFDPVNDFGTFASALGLAADTLSFALGAAAQGAPDSNYTTVYIPQQTVAPALAPQGVTTNFSQALSNTATDLDQAIVDMNAVGITANRYGSAITAGDAASASIQYLAFLQYLGDYNAMAMAASSSLSQLSGILQADGIATQQPTSSAFSQAQSDLQTQGASIPGLYSNFETEGFSNTQIRTMIQQASVSNPATPSESISQAVEDLSTQLLSAAAPLTAPSTTTISSSLNPAITGQTVTFTATVAGSGAIPTGSVTFFDGSTALGAPVALSGGVADFAVQALPVGSHSITAVYAPDGVYAASTSAPISQTITAVATTTTVAATSSSSPNGALYILTATVTSASGNLTPTGLVTFLDGATQIGSADLAGGAATIDISSLGSGTHNITASYGGDSNNLASSSSALSIATPDLSANLVGPVSSSVLAGAPLKLHEKLTLTASNGAVTGRGSATILLSPTESAADSVLTLASASANLKLKAGKGKSFNLRLPKSIASTVAAGMYHVLIYLTDTDGNVFTIDSGETIALAAPMVDITGSFVSVPASATAGRKTRFTFVITNSSTVPADATLPYDIDTSPDGQLSDATLLETGSKRINLKPGMSIKVSATGEFSSSTFLVVNLDPGNTVFRADVNPSNNSFSTANEIVVG